MFVPILRIFIYIQVKNVHGFLLYFISFFKFSSLFAGGRVYTFGDNQSGQLGLDTDKAYLPILLSGSHAQDVSRSKGHFYC